MQTFSLIIFEGGVFFCLGVWEMEKGMTLNYRLSHIFTFIQHVSEFVFFSSEFVLISFSFPSHPRVLLTYSPLKIVFRYLLYRSLLFPILIFFLYSAIHLLSYS